MSPPTIGRIWRAFGLKPHRSEHFKLSTDPQFIEKVRDVVGLFLNPPGKAVVLCVDEKSQIQLGCCSGEIGSGGTGDSRWGDAGQRGRALPAESAGAQAVGRAGRDAVRRLGGGLGQFKATENTLFRRNAS